jgi:1-acyl-sn-glycerol-3-phosphate acyltransferase
MIRADKKPLREKVISRMIFRGLRRSFNAIRVRGAETMEGLDRSLPIIIYGNHSSWWDGFVEYYISYGLYGLDQYLMMEEKQMSRYRFFRWLGAFSVNRDSAREAAVSLRYAISLFDRPGRILCIFPQGVMRPNDSRPLAFSPGLGRIAAGLGKAQLVPMALRYEFLREQRPDILVRLGPVRVAENVVDHRALTRECEETLTGFLDQLRDEVAREDLAPYRIVLTGKASTNVAYDRARLRGDLS